MVLEVKNITKRFGDFAAVDGVSFGIAEGEIFGLLGANGAGKTTTIHLILDLTEPSGGDIVVFGKNLKASREDILQEMNFASPYVWMPQRLTVFENLMVAGGLYGVPGRKKRIRELLDRFEVGDLAGKTLGSLSSGQITRIGLVKSLLNHPKLLLLDEPTASLDPDIAYRTQEILREAQREERMAILYTSHNMAEVEKMCDRIAFMDRGKILAVGTALEVTQAILKEERDRPALEEVFYHVAGTPNPTS